jgi:trehalose-6-phosphate synthase
LNIAFLNAIVEHYQEGDWILVFNYQLMLLPKMLRERPITRNASIGFYLSTLFPSSEMYRMLPQREELLRGVLAASFIGFHNFQYKRHFFTACTRVLGVECSGDCIEPDSAGN